MSVYVDDMKAVYGRLIMCHMVADTEEELHAMADLIGVDRKWYQYPHKSRYPHYDIALSKRALSKRALAVSNGAQEIRWRDAPEICRRCIAALKDTAFLDRICVNYIRHELTSYDYLFAKTAGKTGIATAVNKIRAKIFAEIASVYPVFGPECERQRGAKGA